MNRDAHQHINLMKIFLSSNKKLLLLPSFLTLTVFVILGTAHAEKRPPAYLPCSIFAGESQIFEGICRVRTLAYNKLLIETEKKREYAFLVISGTKNDTVYWNRGIPSVSAKNFLGRALWLDGCWRSTPRQNIPFHICVTK
jgi:hypothetical protein